MIIFLFIISTLSTDSILNQPELNSAQVGIYIFDLINDNVVYGYNSQKLLIPASNMKIITSGTALFFLGKEYRFKTRLALRGKIKNNKLLGDVILIGGGDPGFSLENLQQFVTTIRNMEIKEITGNIIVDDEYFTEERLPMGWSRHYFDARYAPEISALSMNYNCVNVRMQATKIGGYAQVGIEPETKYVKLISKMITKSGDDSVIIYRKPEANIIFVDGGLGVGHKKDIEVALIDPAMFTGIYFGEMLNDSGVNFKGRVIKKKDSKFAAIEVFNSMSVIDSVVSKPLIDIIKDMNTESINLNAEILIKTLGACYNNEGSFNAGLQMVRKFLDMCGVDTCMISLWDGSGLSRHNLISPKDLALVLNHIFHSDSLKALYELFPAPGQGTLEKRFKNFEYGLRAKTGTLDAISCLSGYLKIDESNYCFSMMFNNFICPRERIEQIQEQILEAFGKQEKTIDKDYKAKND